MAIQEPGIRADWLGLASLIFKDTFIKLVKMEENARDDANNDLPMVFPAS